MEEVNEIKDSTKELSREERVDLIRSRRVKDTVELEEHQCYNGNINLKKAGINMPYTKEQIEEIIKCSTDILYFIENYCEIVTLDYGLQPFILYPYQRKMIEAFSNNRKVISLMGRQLGKCLLNQSLIKVRNKKTGLIRDISIGNFFNECNMKNKRRG